MSDDNVVQIRGNEQVPYRPPVTDFWFAQVDLRLDEIERMVRRLEWQVWIIVCGTAALLLIEILRIIAPQ